MMWIFVASQVLQAASSAGLPDFKVSGSREQGFTFETDTIPADQVDAVDLMFMAEAVKLCEPLKPRYGSYSADHADERTLANYRRLIACEKANRGEDQTAPPDFAPIAKDELDAQAAFEAYFAALDGGDFDTAMRLSDPGPWTREQLEQSSKSFMDLVGKGKRVIYRITWKLDPQGQPHRGVYVDISYYGRFSQGKDVCGAALFYRKSEGVYLYSRDLMQVGDSAALPETGNPCPPDSP